MAAPPAKEVFFCEINKQISFTEQARSVRQGDLNAPPIRFAG